MKTAGMESVFRFGAVLSIPHCAQSRGGLSGHQDEIDDILYILVSYQRMRHPGDAFSKRGRTRGNSVRFRKTDTACAVWPPVCFHGGCFTSRTLLLVYLSIVRENRRTMPFRLVRPMSDHQSRSCGIIKGFGRLTNAFPRFLLPYQRAPGAPDTACRDSAPSP